MKARVRIAKKMLQLCDVFFIQEVHGVAAQVELHFRELLGQFWVFDSLMDRAVGGIICFVRKSLCPNKKNICFEHFLRGRIVRLCLLGESDFGDSPKKP